MKKKKRSREELKRVCDYGGLNSASMCVRCVYSVFCSSSFIFLRSIRFVASCSLTSCLQNRVYVCLSSLFFFALFAFGLFFSFFIRFSFTDRFTSKNFNRCLDRARVTVCMLCTLLLLPLLCKCVNVHLIFSLNYADLRSFVRWPGEMRKSTQQDREN